jgi:hypothetical protein
VRRCCNGLHEALSRARWAWGVVGDIMAVERRVSCKCILVAAA